MQQLKPVACGLEVQMFDFKAGLSNLVRLTLVIFYFCTRFFANQQIPFKKCYPKYIGETLHQVGK